MNTGSIITETIGNLTVSGSGIVNAPGSGNAAATNLTAADVHFTGGQGAVSTAASTYTGSTAIQGGTLHVNVNNSTLTGNVTVGGATATGKPTLGGTGTLGGAVTVRSASGGASGVLNPGVAIGTLSVANTVNFETDSIFEVDLGVKGKSGTSDRLSLTSGNFLLSFAQGSVLRLLPGDGFNLTTGDIGFTYLLASVQSGTGASNIAVNGATNLTTISTYTYGSGSVGPVMIDVSALPAFPNGSTLTLSRSGDNLVLTAAVVPEPVTTGLLAAGALGLAGLVRQRRKRLTRQAAC